MEFRIADTFTGSLADLTNQEQKRVKTTAFDLQMDPSRPGMQMHRVDRSRDDHFWSVRVSGDLRLIVHKTKRSFLLCYVDHHDDAYAWAERRKIERHPRTGAAQIVEVQEKTIEVPTYVAPEHPPEPSEESPAPPLFEDVSDEDLLSYGVPEDWLEEVRGATEDTVLDVADRLPAEAAEAVLDLAVGETPSIPTAGTDADDPFEHPDAQRRFRTITGQDELERALDFPWDKWAVFLHPSQRAIVEKEYNGPARVAGSAGTGKTVVALHRAVHLAEEHPDARVLLTTFSDPLARSLEEKLRTLISNRPRLRERLDVRALDAAALRLQRVTSGEAEIATEQTVADTIAEVAERHEGHGFTQNFLLAEWRQVVDPWQLDTWEAYRDVPRAGRKKRLPKSHRETLWKIFEDVRSSLSGQGVSTMASVYSSLTAHYREHPSPYDFVVVDEAQDVSVAQLRFLSALAGNRPDGLFFAGDLGQRIFQPPFSWKRLGVDVRGRSSTLRINYRTSHQIRRHADRLLEPELADVDGVVESRQGTQSVFNGPDPQIRLVESREEEVRLVAERLATLRDEGVAPEEMGIFVRSSGELEYARDAAEEAGLPFRVLDEKMRPAEEALSICTMHLAKGLEFRSVAVMACDDETIPQQERIENVGDIAELEEVYDTERHLLYVACTRARDHLLVSALDPGSEFLDDLVGEQS
ncbi:MAG: UvrD-helicase domain-containing protein [Bacteroidetes bacterium]|jgi:hypothetical protein|nr:UvrD-helicase domain-containing protein [Bacteroidota bacterium]